MQLCEHDVFFFTTFGGEALSLAAAKATIEVMREIPVFDHIERTGRKLQRAVDVIAGELSLHYVRCVGYPQRALVKIDSPSTSNPPPVLAIKALLQQEMIARGVLWSGFHNLALAHDEDDIAQVVEAYRQSLPIVHRAVLEGRVHEQLRGEPLVPVFRKVENFHTKPVVRRSEVA